MPPPSPDVLPALHGAPAAERAAAILPVPVGVVLGCPRSGSTFLMRALSTLPDTACLTGIAYPITLSHVVAASPLAPEVREALLRAFPASLAQYLQSALFKARAAGLQKWWNERSGLAGLRRALRGERRVDRLVFKEPFLSFAPEIVLESLPEAPVVYLLRDGRDVANSLVRTYDVLSDERLTRLTHSEMHLGRRVDHRYVPWWVEEGAEDDFLAAPPYVRAVWMWKAMVERCDAAFGAAPEGRVLTVRYETFMPEPVTSGEVIAAHLGAEPTARYLGRLREAHVASIGSYRKRAPDEIAAAERVAGGTLARLGYR
ncbi:MAG: sulfotransferase [Rubricoccaceae bacterium]|nr:sulfotransferase [Rubricoccaceae bacterium]